MYFDGHSAKKASIQKEPVPKKNTYVVAHQEEKASIQLPTQPNMKLPFVHYVKGSGRVTPSSDYVKINTRVEGIVEHIYVNIGKDVREGDLLFRINDNDLRCVYKEKVAQYQTAQTKLRVLQTGSSLLEIQAKEREVDQIRAKLVRQEKDYQTFEQLFAQCAVSQNEKEQKEILVEETQMDLDNALFELESLKQGPSDAELSVDKALVFEKESAIRSVEKKIKDCQVRSPISGKVLDIRLNCGQYVDATQPAYVIVGNDKPLHMVASIAEKDAWRISPNKGLRAIAVHKNNPSIYFILSFIQAKPVIHQSPQDGSRELELVFSFDKEKAPVYLEQCFDVYIESTSPQDTAFLDYQFNQLRENL